MGKLIRDNLYSEYMEKKAPAPYRVIAARDALHDAFDEYVEALQEWEFNSTVDFISNRAFPEKGDREG